jgi:hypothetical protein
MIDTFTIPFDGVQYLCWKESGTPKHRAMTDAEFTRYVTSEDQERTLHDILKGR